MTTRGVDTATALHAAGIRARHAPKGCAGGRHVMARDPDGPHDRPWKCRMPDCPHEQPWSGGYAAWLANHAPVVLAAAIVGQEAPDA